MTVVPLTQARVVAPATGVTVEPLAAAMPERPRVETRMLVAPATAWTSWQISG